MDRLDGRWDPESDREEFEDSRKYPDYCRTMKVTGKQESRARTRSRSEA